VAPFCPPVYVKRPVAPFSKVLILLLGAVSAGCAHVPPYARERLAHPTMQLAEMAGAAEAHVNAVHEGATGGAAVASSGCGCN
jgi:hypothetical protein